MTSRDAAIEAAARALWATGGTDWCEANADERHYHRDCAETALDAALAVLQPTIDNTVEALDKLPVGTVLVSGRQEAFRMIHQFTDDELAAHDAEVRAQALREAADELDLPGSTATGYYASEQDSGYRDAERDANQWLRDRARALEVGND